MKFIIIITTMNSLYITVDLFLIQIADIATQRELLLYFASKCNLPEENLARLQAMLRAEGGEGEEGGGGGVEEGGKGGGKGGVAIAEQKAGQRAVAVTVGTQATEALVIGEIIQREFYFTNDYLLIGEKKVVFYGVQGAPNGYYIRRWR